MIDASLAACAPAVAPATLARVIHIESGGRPFAINVNKGPRMNPPRSAAEAAATARVWIARGHSVDLGLMQVNSRNLARLGFTIEQMFDPCTNVRAGAQILTENYVSAAKSRGHGQHALRDALSAYNTGSFQRGYTNGYVGKYYSMPYTYNRIGAVVASPTTPVADPYTADTSVFSRKDTVND